MRAESMCDMCREVGGPRDSNPFLERDIPTADIEMMRYVSRPRQILAGGDAA